MNGPLVNKPEKLSAFKREPRATILFKCYASAMQVLSKCYASAMQVLCKKFRCQYFGSEDAPAAALFLACTLCLNAHARAVRFCARVRVHSPYIGTLIYMFECFKAYKELKLTKNLK